jgi:nicotinamidase-related amidase
MVAYDGKTALIVVDMENDVADKDTALEALPLGFETTVLSKAVRAVDRGSRKGNAALGEIRGARRVE